MLSPCGDVSSACLFVRIIVSGCEDGQFTRLQESVSIDLLTYVRTYALVR